MLHAVPTLQAAGKWVSNFECELPMCGDPPPSAQGMSIVFGHDFALADSYSHLFAGLQMACVLFNHIDLSGDKYLTVITTNTVDTPQGTGENGIITGTAKGPDGTFKSLNAAFTFSCPQKVDGIVLGD
jgi:hypothetical protein